MTTATENYVGQLTNEEIDCILKSYEDFRALGSTADSPIRKYAVQLMKSLNIETEHTVAFMEILANECYRQSYWKNKH